MEAQRAKREPDSELEPLNVTHNYEKNFIKILASICADIILEEAKLRKEMEIENKLKVTKNEESSPLSPRKLR